MIRPWLILLLVGLALEPAAAEARAKSKPSAPSITDRRAEDLLGQARRARTEGRVTQALEYYGRAYRFSTSVGEIAVTEVLAMLDRIRVELVSGDRQSATATSSPRAPLMVRVVLEEPGPRLVPAVGVPVRARWADGEGEVAGEMSSDAHGMVTLTVVRVPDVATPRLAVAVDGGRLPFVAEARDDHALLLADAQEALSRRGFAFEFVPAQQMKKSRILVLIEETVFGRPARESILADQLTTALVDQGLKVIGTTELGKSHHDKIRQSFDRDEWNALRGELRQLCDLVVYGRVEVRKDAVNAGGGMWSVARGRVGIYGVYSPEILGSADFSDIAVLRGDTWENGAEECLRRCATRSREKLLPLAVRAASEPPGER